MGVAVPGGFRNAGASLPAVAPFPVAAHRTGQGGFPASGSRTRSCLRPRKTRRSRSKVREPVLDPQSLVREAHTLPGPHLVLATEPLAQPPGGVPVNRRVGRANLAQGEVVRPAGQQPVEATHHDLGFQKPVTRRGQLTHATANALDARRARAGADVGLSRVPAIVAANPVAEECQRLPRHPAAAGSSRR